MRTLLYVEDDPKSRVVMNFAERMSPGSFQIIMFEDSEDFENRVESLDVDIDLVMLDIHVEPLDGFEMLAILQTMPRFNGTPIIALTASVMSDEVENLRRAGFDGVLSKPVNLDDFPDIVERVIGGEKIWMVW